jgi:hypothetical protein
VSGRAAVAAAQGYKHLLQEAARSRNQMVSKESATNVRKR